MILRRRPHRRSSTSRRRQRRWLRLGAGSAASLLGVFGSVWLLDDVVGGADIPRGTTVGDVSVGALDIDDARGLIDGSTMIEATPVVLRLDGRVHETSGAELGLTIDVEATLNEAARRPSMLLRPPVWLIGLLRQREVDPVVLVDRDRLAAAVDAMLQDPSAPRLGLDQGVLVALPGAEIPIPDLDQVESDVAAAVAGAIGEQVVVDVVVSGRTTTDHVESVALANEANRLTEAGATVELSGGSQRFFVDAAALRSWVEVREMPQGATLAFADEAALATLDSLFAGEGSEGSEAEFHVDDAGNLSIVGGEPGRECCAPEAAATLMAGLRAGHRVIELPARSVPHPRGREWAAGLGIDELVGEFTTSYTAGQSRVDNIVRISDLTRGVIIEPGATFSVNEFVGRRTAEKGFVAAGVIYNGIFREDIGGGISQFATTLFNAAFFAGLDFGEYQSHTIYIPRYPYGREATLSYPHPDLEIINSTPHPVLVWPTTTDTTITVRLYSTRTVVGEQTGQREARDGSCTRVITERTRTWPDGRTEVDNVVARYRPEGVACDGSSTLPTTTPPPTTTVAPDTTLPPESTTTTTTTMAPPTTAAPETTTTTTVAP